MLSRKLKKRRKENRKKFHALVQRGAGGFRALSESQSREKNGCLGNKTGQPVAYTLPRASNLFGKCRLEQVADPDDAKKR